MGLAMSLADDLLVQAEHLANWEDGEPTQAALRRAVSTAYYAIFHLLIDEAVGKWIIVRQRSILARIFDHGKMKKVCEEHFHQFPSAGRPMDGALLAQVAQFFGTLQEKRLTADYDNSFEWNRTNAMGQVNLAFAAFDAWRKISETAAAQDFLLMLFLTKLPRQ
jgi:uncharacterized protein (UPF0332 family)